MTPNKLYTYDYKATIPVTQTKIQSTPVTPGKAKVTPTAYPVQGPNVISTLLIIILLVAIAYLGYSLFPKKSSKTPTANTSAGNLTPTPAEFVIPTTEPELTDTTGPTTKGGLPLSNTSTTNWIKNRYPSQRLIVFLPPGYHSTNVTRNLTTKIQTFTINPDITVSIQPDWVNTGNAQTQGITFMLKDETPVTSTVSPSGTNYYFEKFNQVYIFACPSGNPVCTEIVKSIQFT